jgi:hypothetical protein
MRTLRTIHGGLVHLFAALVAVQFFLAGYGAFKTVNEEKFNDSNFDAHALVGDILILLSLILLLLALIGRWSPRARNWSGLLFGLMVIQVLLAGLGTNESPWLGALHALNALVIVAVVAVLIRDARVSRALAQGAA